MKRLIGAAILIVILALPAILGPPWVFLTIVTLVIPVCLYELYRVILSKDDRILGWIAIAGSFPFNISIYRAHYDESIYIICIISLVIIVTGLYLFEKGKATAVHTGLAIFGIIYPLVLTSFWILLRNGIDGRFWMIFGLLCTFTADAGAYYVGKNLGKRHLAPRLSPKKTIEGLVGGIITSAILGSIFYLIYARVFSLEYTYPVWLIVTLASLIAIIGLLGDLTASMIKREFAVKDMGNLIPGHGGMLDRMDGVIPVGVTLYIIISVL